MGKGFGVNLYISRQTKGAERLQQQLEIIAEEGVLCVKTAGASPESILPILRDAGIKVLHKVPAVRYARTAARLGVDAVIGSPRRLCNQQHGAGGPGTHRNLGTRRNWWWYRNRSSIKACAQALVCEGVNVVITARGEQALNAAAAELKAINSKVSVIALAGDISTAEGRTAALSALIKNAGGLKALDANMLSPIELIKATIDGMAQRGFGRIVNITSSAVKSPIESLGLSNGPRSRLTGFIAGLAREDRIASRNVTINNLQPGSFDTDRLRATLVTTGQEMAQGSDAFREVEIPAKRFGIPEEFGALCAFVCSSHASYLTAQNLLIDGGAIRSNH